MVNPLLGLECDTGTINTLQTLTQLTIPTSYDHHGVLLSYPNYFRAFYFDSNLYCLKQQIKYQEGLHQMH